MMANSNARRTAILVIHGIGEQSPFETLDSFARKLWEILDPDPTRPNLLGQHVIKARNGWTEHYFSLSGAATHEPVVDIHEYYWAHQMSEKITLPEIVDWLLKVSAGARKYYGQNEALRQKYEAMGVKAFDRSGRFKSRWYLRHVGWLLRGLGFLRSIGIPAIPLLEPLITGLVGRVSRSIVNYVGDVAIYTTTDIKSKHYEIRSRILTESVQQMELLLKEYERLVIVAHSLGSVIAFDTLNRVNLEMNAAYLFSGSRVQDSRLGDIRFTIGQDRVLFPRAHARQPVHPAPDSQPPPRVQGSGPHSSAGGPVGQESDPALPGPCAVAKFLGSARPD